MLKLDDINNKVKDVVYLEDCKASMLRGFREGYAVGRETGFIELDKKFKWLKQDVTLFAGIGGMGKALSIETDIPTINGWKKMKDIIVGDKLFDDNGFCCNVIATTNIMHNRDCYEIIFNDGTKIIADKEHEWVTDTEKSRRSYKNAIKNNRVEKRDLKKYGTDQSWKRTYPAIKTTKEISTSIIGRVKKSGERSYNHSISFAKAIQLPVRELLINPYALGVWLGDGTSGNASLTSNDVEIIDRLKEIGLNITKQKAKYRYGIIKGFLTKLRDLNLLNNKHIPIEYLRASKGQRLELLKGLMDTDGFIDKTSRCEFTNINKKLSYQVYELITSLGLRATINEYDAKLYGRIISKKYRINFKPFFHVFTLKKKLKRHTNKIRFKYRKIVSCNKIKSVPVKCIQVDSPKKLFLCTKSYIPTHNSTFCYQLALIQAVQNGTKWAIFSPEQNPPDYFYNDLIHTFVGARVEKRSKNQIPEDLYFKGMDFIKKHFFYVFPVDDSPTPEYINSRFEELIKIEQIEGCITDPFNQLTNDWEKTGRDDRYISSYLQAEKRFAQTHNVFKVTIMHPNSAVRIGDNGNFNCPNVYNLSGGAMWNNHADNIIFIHRPESITNTDNMTTIFKAAKIKKQKLVGFPGEVIFEFDRETNRFYQEGRNPLGDLMSAVRSEPLF